MMSAPGYWPAAWRRGLPAVEPMEREAQSAVSRVQRTVDYAAEAALAEIRAAREHANRCHARGRREVWKRLRAELVAAACL